MGLTKALVSWSSGKDSAWVLQRMRESGDYEIAGLVTTLNQQHDRVSIHGVARALLEAQIKAVGIPLWPVTLPDPCSNEQYEMAMSALYARARAEEITVIAFGDLFLEDVRKYREEHFNGSGIQPIFPLWKQPTTDLLREMLIAGVRATIVSVDTTQLSTEFAGRNLDSTLLEELPAHVDACGENGEFHTFVHAGPFFRQPITIHRGATVVRDRFAYADLTLA